MSRWLLGIALTAGLVGEVAQAAPPDNWTAYPSEADFEAAETQVRDRASGGRALMQCSVQDDGALSACRVLRETPLGSGYGEVLLSLAPKYRRKPPGKSGAREVVVPATWYRFDSAPDWLKRPTPESLRAVYPREAVRRGVDGRAVISCVITTQGALQDCFVTEESPTGLGFGGAALALTPQLMFKPARLNGVPVVSSANVPINWKGMEGMSGALLGRSVLPPTLPWSAAPSFADVAAAYPPKARAERRGGRATVSCAMSEAGALKNCTEVSSEPRGYGFGDAAKSLAKTFRLPVTSDADRKATHNVMTHLMFVFDPMMLETTSPIVGKPNWASNPSVEDVRAAFTGLKLTGTARVQLDCVAQPAAGSTPARLCQKPRATWAWVRRR